jgi:hypothetical protein
VSAALQTDSRHWAVQRGFRARRALVASSTTNFNESPSSNITGADDVLSEQFHEINYRTAQLGAARRSYKIC